MTWLFGGPDWEPSGFWTRLIIAPSAAARARAYFWRFQVRGLFAPLFWTLVTLQTVVGFIIPGVVFMFSDLWHDRRVFTFLLLALNAVLLAYYVGREFAYQRNLRIGLKSMRNGMLPPASVMVVPPNYHRYLFANPAAAPVDEIGRLVPAPAYQNGQYVEMREFPRS